MEMWAKYTEQYMHAHLGDEILHSDRVGGVVGAGRVAPESMPVAVEDQIKSLLLESVLGENMNTGCGRTLGLGWLNMEILWRIRSCREDRIEEMVSRLVICLGI